MVIVIMYINRIRVKLNFDLFMIRIGTKNINSENNSENRFFNIIQRN